MSDIEDAREKRIGNQPHKVRRFLCLTCGHGAATPVLDVMPIGADETTLECPRCGARTSETDDAENGPMLPHETDPHQVAADAAGNLLECLELKVDPETPARMAKALRELTEGYATTDLVGMLKAFDAPPDPGIVCVRGVTFASLCEHHVLPFTGLVSVAYIPSAKVVGLSKIPRLIRAVTRRLQLQERIGQQVADALVKGLDPIGVMVIVRARHTCMGLRGIESPGEMVTSCVRGAFAKEPEARAEAMALLTGAGA